MNNEAQIEEKIWDYIDGTASSKEMGDIKDLIESNKVWKLKYEELNAINALLLSSELEMPSLRFTKNVMESITQMQITPATKSYLNNKIIGGLAFFFITLIVGFLIYGFAQVNWDMSGETSFSKQFNKIDISVFFNSTLMNVFMMINVILGLILLDHYFNVKRKEFER